MNAEEPVFPELSQLRTRTGIKWQQFDESLIPAWIADMDAMPAPAVRDALIDVIDRGDLGYPSHLVADRLADAFARRQSTRHGWTPDPTLVRLVVDVVQGIALFIHQFTQPGDGVIVLGPSYPPILRELERSGRRVVMHELRVDDDWRLRSGELDAVMAPDVTAMILVNPHNPTGRIFRRDELQLIAELAVERDLVVLSDEIHQDLVWDGLDHLPLASLSPAILERTVTMTSAAKGFNIAGLKCAVAHFGSDRLAARFDEYSEALRGEVSALGIAATIAAWTDGEPWLEAMRATLVERRDQLTEAVTAHLPDARYRPPEATYLAWIDLAAYDLGEDPAVFFETNGLVALEHGPNFGPPGVGHVRVNFATSRVILDEVLERMVTAIDLARSASG